MTLTKDDLDTRWRSMFMCCNNPETAKAEVLALFSEDPDDEHEWSNRISMSR